MSRPKRKSPVLAKAQQRSDLLATIDAKLDLGEGLTLTAYDNRIATLEKQLGDYNGLLAKVDSAAAVLDTLEADVADWNERMLKGVSSRYGRNSAEYGQAGGTRKSDIKRRSRKSKAAASAKN